MVRYCRFASNIRRRDTAERCGPPRLCGSMAPERRRRRSTSSTCDRARLDRRATGSRRRMPTSSAFDGGRLIGRRRGGVVTSPRMTIPTSGSTGNYSFRPAFGRSSGDRKSAPHADVISIRRRATLRPATRRCRDVTAATNYTSGSSGDLSWRRS